MVFQKGHKIRMGMKHSEVTKRLIGKKGLGRIPWNKGLTKEIDERVKKKGRVVGFKKGYTPWNKGLPSELQPSYGRKVSKATREKNGFAHRKENLSPEQYKKIVERNRMLGKKHRGKNNHSWKGGITPKSKKIRESIEYRLWREAVFARDNFTCQRCGKRGGKLHAHHIKTFAKFPELRFAIDNGITFCIPCHRKEHRKK